MAIGVVRSGSVVVVELQEPPHNFLTPSLVEEVVAALEMKNMVDVAQAVSVSAAARLESRGAHTCRDFSSRDDENFMHHTLCYLEAGGPRLDKKSVHLGHWEPEERKY